MERLTVKKKLAIVTQYLSGLSYDEIAEKNGISKGTVANVVADLKAGKFPEAADVVDQIGLLRELAVELKRSKLIASQCALGLIVIRRINECGLDPADIDRWPLILQCVKNEDEAQEFVRLVYGIQEIQKRTGLNLNDLDNKAHEMEKKAADLEPILKNIGDYKKQIDGLTRQREKLDNEVANLEQKYQLLNPRTKDLEKREQDLSRRINEKETRTHKAETTLATFSKEMQRLQDIGLTFEELSKFTQRVQAITQQHNIKPEELSDRLLHELENLEKGIGLEALIQSRQEELDKQEKAVAKARQESETIKSVVAGLKQEKANLEAGIKETREMVSQEIARIVPVARDTVNQLTKELRGGVDKTIAEVGRLREQSLEVGKEVGRYEGILETNVWLKELLALVRSEESIQPKEVRAITLSVLRGVSGWLKTQDKYSSIFISLSLPTDNLIREMEQWKA